MNVQLPVRQAILDRRTYEPPGEGRANKVRLDFNENTAGCSPAVKRALAKLSPKQLAMYPEYERGTKRLARHFGVKPEELLLTNGGDDALRLFFDAFVDSGSSVVICEPTFPMYRYWGEVAGAKIEALRYGSAMEFPLDSVLNALGAHPRAVFICNPNNPTGTLLSKGYDRDHFESGDAHGGRRRRSLRRIFRCEHVAMIRRVSTALRCTHVLKGRGTRGPAARRGHRLRGLALDFAPRHGSLPCQRRRTGRRRSSRKRSCKR